MTTEITIRNSIPTFANKDLNKATKKIFNIAENLRKSALETAYIVAMVDETECYKDDGFNSVHEWVEKVFGLKKSASYTLLKIGREYIVPVINAKGKTVGYITNLSGQPEVADYGITQLEKMLPAGHELAKKLSDDEEISPYMTCKEIEEVIKKHTKAEPEEVVEVNEEECKTVMDEEGNKYYIPISILGMYKV